VQKARVVAGSNSAGGRVRRTRLPQAKQDNETPTADNDRMGFIASPPGGPSLYVWQPGACRRAREDFRAVGDRCDVHRTTQALAKGQARGRDPISPPGPNQSARRWACHGRTVSARLLRGT